MIQRDPVAEQDARLLSVARMLERLAQRSERLAEHSEQTGILAGQIAEAMDLDDDGIADATYVGLLHEVAGILIRPDMLERASFASDSELMRLQRMERRRAVGLCRSQPEIADLANLVGSTFDDIVPTMIGRIVIVADTFDHLTSSTGLSAESAARILRLHVGVRYDKRAVTGLEAVLRSRSARVRTA